MRKLFLNFYTKYKILHTKYCLGLFLGVSILFIYTDRVFAAPESLQVNPAIEELSISPGKVTTYQLTITNTGDRPVGLHAQLGDFTSPDDIGDTAIINSPLISWTGITPNDILLAPQEKKSFTVTISPPASLKQGGYYAAIFLTPFVDKQQEQNAPVVLTQIGTLLLAQYGPTDYTHLKDKVSLTSVGFNSFIIERLPLSFHFSLKNGYFTHFTAKPFLTLTPLFGTPQTFTLSEKHILPGKSKLWNETIHPSQLSILYTAHLNVSVGAGNYISADSFVIVIPGFHYILIVILLILILSIGVFYKRVQRAIRIIVTGK